MFKLNFNFIGVKIEMAIDNLDAKSITASTFQPSIFHEVMGADVMLFVFFNVEF